MTDPEKIEYLIKEVNLLKLKIESQDKMLLKLDPERSKKYVEEKLRNIFTYLDVDPFDNKKYLIKRSNQLYEFALVYFPKTAIKFANGMSFEQRIKILAEEVNPAKLDEALESESKFGDNEGESLSAIINKNK